MEKLGKLKTDDAFIAANKYIVKEINDFGCGVKVSYDEEIEKNEANTLDGVLSNSFWFNIKIPAKEYLLDMYKPVTEQSEEVQNALLHKDCLGTLFFHDTNEMVKRLDTYLKTIPAEKQSEVYTQEMQLYYDRKKQIIKDLDSGFSLLNFIKSHTKSKSIEIASSFLCINGIYGSLYNDEKGQRILVYDAQTHIKPDNINFKRLVPVISVLRS